MARIRKKWVLRIVSGSPPRREVAQQSFSQEPMRSLAFACCQGSPGTTADFCEPFRASFVYFSSHLDNKHHQQQPGIRPCRLWGCIRSTTNDPKAASPVIRQTACPHGFLTDRCAVDARPYADGAIPSPVSQRQRAFFIGSKTIGSRGLVAQRRLIPDGRWSSILRATTRIRRAKMNESLRTKWWNWKTHDAQNVAPQGMGVQVSPWLLP